jgi:CheY-like chemotaxis protein
MQNGRVRIVVRDTGAGLDPQQLAALFQPFNRLGREGGPESGSGIGLVLTKRLVEAMQGTIGVDSAPGQGSAFWIELHGADDGDVLPTYFAQQAPLSSTSSAAAPPPMATVLYVEDDLASIELVRAALGVRADVELLSASNGRLGVELARAHLPTVILMDNNMPELSGLEARAILQRDPRTAHIPVIALSASAPAAPVDGMESPGYFRRLVKPFDVRELLGVLDEALRVARARAQDFSRS